jgi:hypothetical protein
MAQNAEYNKVLAQSFKLASKFFNDLSQIFEGQQKKPVAPVTVPALS